jgi:Raf kinase inhibitor-like YbhB/YbcL family protein
MKLTSTRFHHGRSIPKPFTGEGADISPPLEWSEAPEGTRSFALICGDPDAPVHRHEQDHPFVHWLIYGISPATSALPEGLPPAESITTPISAQQGRNSFGSMGYRGPMPPLDHGPHRYVFTLYALDADLGLRGGATKRELLAAMRGHIIAIAGLKGIYERGALRYDFNGTTGKISGSRKRPGLESRPSP